MFDIIIDDIIADVVMASAALRDVLPNEYARYEAARRDVMSLFYLLLQCLLFCRGPHGDDEEMMILRYERQRRR